MTDGPIKFVGNLEDDLNIVNVSKFGRSFSIVRVPYAFKLLMQELQTMNVQMHIITSDNVSQLTSMSYSDNYKILSGKDLLSAVGRAHAEQPVKEKKKKKVQLVRPTPTKALVRPLQDYTAVPPPAELLEDIDPDEAWLAARLPGGILAEQEAPEAYSPPEHYPDRSPTPDYSPPEELPASPVYRPQSPDYPPPDTVEEVPSLESMPSIEYSTDPQFVPIDRYESLRTSDRIVEPRKVEPTTGGNKNADSPLLKTIVTEVDISEHAIQTIKIET
jgi:hypothetical protein